MRWRIRGDVSFAAVGAGRVYAETPHALRILDLRTGRPVARRPPLFTRIRFARGG